MRYWNNFKTTIEKQATIFLFCATLFVMSLLFQALFLTWLSQFKIIYLSVSLIISLVLTIIFFSFIKKDIHRLPRISIQAIGLIIIVCLIGLLFPHETFGGRDEGSYSNIAVMLGNNANLIFSPDIHSTIGNYLGEDTQNVVGVATPGYYVWLAIQNIFLGVGWMLRSNIILVSLGICSLFFVASLTNNKTLGFITIALYTSSMPFLWFFRETMSENLAFFLLWTSVVFLLTFLKTKRAFYLLGLMLGTWLFSFTRLEGLLIQFSTFVFLFFTVLVSKIFSLNKAAIIITAYAIIISSTLYIQKPFTTNSFFRTNIHNVQYVIKRSISAVQKTNSAPQSNAVSSDNIKFVDYIPFFSFLMLAKYNLVIALLSIFLILPLLVIDKGISKPTKMYFFAILTIFLPEFYKFVNPSVTMEQPWMYRRYLYALLPIGYMCFAFLLSRLMDRKFVLFSVIVVLTINIFLSRNILFLKNNWSITARLDRLLKNISPADDFVIVKEWTILDNYYPTTYLTYHKGIRALVRYMVDEKGWSSKEKTYNGIPYKKTYLLSDKEPESYKNYVLIKVDSIDVKYRQLQPNCTLGALNKELGLTSANLYLLPYSNAVAYCSKTDNKILDVKKKIYLYELIDQNI